MAKYYIEVLFTSHGAIRMLTVKTYNANGLRNDEDIILSNLGNLTRFLFMVETDDPKEEEFKEKANYLYKLYKQYGFELTWDADCNFHFHPTKPKFKVEKGLEVAYLITNFNGTRQDPIEVVTKNCLRKEMYHISLKYDFVRAEPIPLVSFAKAFDF